MRKKYSWILCFALAMTLVLSACSGGASESENNAQGSADTTGTAGQTSTNSPTASEDPLAFPLNEKVTLKIDAYKATANKVSDYNDYELYQNLEKQTNVHIDWTLYDTATKVEKLNLMAASGQYPDAIYGALPTGLMLNSWAEQGIAIPLNDLIDEYAPNLKKAFEENPLYKDIVTHPDGKIYSLPNVVERPFQEATDTMFINKAWLDQVGLAVPTTTDELYEALKAFKGKDLNGNGKMDEIPMSFMNRSHWKGGHSLAMAFDVMDHMYTHTYVKDGQVLYAPYQEEYRDYAEYFHKLYSEGLIDPEMFTQDDAVYKAKRTGEYPILGVMVMPTSAAFTNSKDYVPMLGLKGPNGDFGWTRDRPGIQYGAFVITSANKNPELTMKWIDSHYDYEFGLQLYAGPIGKGIKKVSDTKYEYIQPPEGVNSGDFTLSMAPEWASPKIIPAKSYKEEWFIGDDEKAELEMYRLKEPLFKYTPPKDKIYASEDYDKIETFEEINGKNGYIDQTFADFVVKGVTDEKWNNHKKQLEKFGVADYIKTLQKYE